MNQFLTLECQMPSVPMPGMMPPAHPQPNALEMIGTPTSLRVRGHDEVIRGHSEVIRGHSEVIGGHDEVIGGHDEVIRGQAEAKMPQGGGGGGGDSSLQQQQDTRGRKSFF